MQALITGASGFLGRRLVADLIAQTDLRLWLLARDPAACAMRFRDLPQHRMKIVPGDVGRTELGLSPTLIQQLAPTLTEIWHLGAATSFRESDRADLMRVNVEGTQHLLDLAEKFPRLKRLYHMSTAYVAGRRTEPTPEDMFDASAGFKNPYEESKYAAELLIREASVPWVIFRPSIVMGDSNTGRCDGEMRMMYGFVAGVWRAVLRAFDSSDAYWQMWMSRNGDTNAHPSITATVAALGSATTNLVTRDDVSRVCLAARSACEDRVTYNIVNPRSLTNRQIMDQIQRVLKVRDIRLDPHRHELPSSQLSMVERVAVRNTRLFWPYITNHSPAWITDNVDRLKVPRVEMTEALFHHLIESFFRRMVPR